MTRVSPLRGVLLVLAGLLVAAPGTIAQQASSSTASISGRVVDDATGAPLADATVALHAQRAGLGSADAHTDENGAFSFSGLPAGDYALFGAAHGYLATWFGQRREDGETALVHLDEGGRRAAIAIRLLPESTIAGVVTGDAGEPLGNVKVDIWRVVGESDRTTYRLARTADTNEMGAYQATLGPGTYVVGVPIHHETERQPSTSASGGSCGAIPPPPPPTIGASPPNAIAASASAAPTRPAHKPGELFSMLSRGIPSLAPDSQGRRTYVSTFFPGMTDIDSGMRIDLGTAEHRGGVDVRLSVTRAVDLEGRLTGERGAGIVAAIEMRHRGRSATPFSEASVTTAAGGTFRVVDIPPGRYELNAILQTPSGCDVTAVFSDDPFGHVIVDVGEDGAQTIDVPMTRGLTVSGSVTWNGSSPHPEQITVAAINDEPDDEGRLSSRVSGRDARFAIRTVRPGAYAFQVYDGHGWLLERVTKGGEDVTDRITTIDTDETDVDIRLTDRIGHISGRVFDPAGAVSLVATVVAFPVDRSLRPRSGHYSSRFAFDRARSGDFALSPIVAGDYYLAAIDDAEMQETPSAEWFDRIAKSATKMTVSAGGNVSINLIVH